MRGLIENPRTYFGFGGVVAVGFTEGPANAGGPSDLYPLKG